MTWRPIPTSWRMVAASAALTLSGVPFMGPIGGARVGYIKDEIVVNPTLEQMKDSALDLVVAGTADAVLMVESEAKELSEDTMLKAVMAGHAAFQPVIDAIIRLAEKAAQGAARARRSDKSRGREGRARSRRGGPARRLCDHPEAGALRRGRRRQGKGRRRAAARRRRSQVLQGRGRRGLPQRAGQGRALEHPRPRPPHRRARSDDGPSDSRPRSACCRAPTARRCSPAARRRRWSSPRSAPARTSSSSTRWKAPTRSASCCTTTSLPIPSARPAAWARRDGARSATASSPGARSIRCCRRRPSSPTRSASSRRSPSPTAPRRWRRSAAPRWR